LAVELGFWIPIANGKIPITLHRATFNMATLRYYYEENPSKGINYLCIDNTNLLRSGKVGLINAFL